MQTNGSLSAGIFCAVHSAQHPRDNILCTLYIEKNDLQKVSIVLAQHDEIFKLVCFIFKVSLNPLLEVDALRPTSQMI
jgi:hypothetical protein